MNQLILAFALFALGAAAQTPVRDPLPVPDLPSYRTLKCDFHMHTVFSDGEVWPVTRVNEAWRDGLDAIAITDHAGYNPHKQDISPELNRPFAIASAAAARAGVVLIPAVEVAEGDLHANALFVKDANAFLGLKLAEALRQARAQNAFVFWNHPGWKRTAEWFPPIAALHEEKLIQGVELVNGLDFYKEAFPWIGEKSLAILADSDVHAPIATDYKPRQRPLTLVFAKTADVEGIREALFARRTAAWMGGEVWGAEPLLKGLWEGAIKARTTELAFAPGVRSAAVEVHNTSAIPFRLRVAKAPEWLTLRVGDVPGERIASFAVSLAKTAPEGTTAAPVELEITNFHVAPGRNLSVTLPLSISVKR